MSIVKADAFANAVGMILDTFKFVDLHRTLELNPSERDRFKQNLIDVLKGTLELEKLLSGRARAEAASQPKIEVTTRVRFDNQTSSHSTLLELIAQDRPGLLFDVSSVLADQGCNIEVALIDTEGQRAIDVFYLTCQWRQARSRDAGSRGQCLAAAIVIGGWRSGRPGEGVAPTWSVDPRLFLAHRGRAAHLAELVRATPAYCPRGTVRTHGQASATWSGCPPRARARAGSCED